MHEKKIMIWLCHGAAPCATLLCVRDVSDALKEFHIVTRRVLHFKWLSDFFLLQCSVLCCAFSGKENREHGGSSEKTCTYVCVCAWVCVIEGVKCQVVSGGSLMRV